MKPETDLTAALIDGELDLSAPDQVHGWLALLRENDANPFTVSLHLLGQAEERLRGKRLRFVQLDASPMDVSSIDAILEGQVDHLHFSRMPGVEKAFSLLFGWRVEERTYLLEVLAKNVRELPPRPPS